MSDFGARLREARERRGISLKEISDRTKISVPALESLERNDPSRLPGGIFSRAFIRSYAVEVGLDPDATVREFLARFDSGLHGIAYDTGEPPAPPPAALPAHTARIAVTIIAAALALMALIFYFARSGMPDTPSNGPAANDIGRRGGRRQAATTTGPQRPARQLVPELR